MKKEVKVNLALVKEMGLSRQEFTNIKKIMGRTPNVTELGVFSAMWSEHCSYKNSRKQFKKFPKRSKQVLIGAGEENSGIVDIGDGYGVSFKMESHNHPSAVEPFEASATGIGGCLRDIFTTGARPVAVLGAVRFGSLDTKKVKYLFKEVVRGLVHYASKSEVSAVGGDTYFDKCYEGNPLVNAFCVGVVKHKNIMRGAACGVGNPVYYIGGDTGRDGVGGASFASQEITDDSASDTGRVAIGDPELGKRLRHACLELIEKGLVAGMQDMGAAGLTCSSCETASRSGTGIEIDVALVPQREKNMTAYEILLSESQERMLAILNHGSEKKAMSVLKKWGINAVAIGKVIKEKTMRVKEKGVVVCQVPISALTQKAPLYDRPSRQPKYLKPAQKLDLSKVSEPKDMNKVLLKLLDSPTIASKESAYSKFAYVDKDDVILNAGSDAAIIRVKGTKKALALSVDCNGRFCYLNPYQGAMMNVAEAARNVVCAGARPLAITDGLNFGNPMKPENYWQFEKCIDGLSRACAVLNTPVVSGNVSFYNENPKGAIDPSPMVGMVGLIEDAGKYVTQNFKTQQDVIVLLGESRGDLSGSEYLYLIHDMKKGNPSIDIEAEKRLHETVLSAIDAGIIRSAHDLSEGGLAVALTESAISDPSRMLGACVNLEKGGMRTDELLFGEAPSRIIVSLDKAALGKLQAIAAKNKTRCSVIGVVGSDALDIRVGGRSVINAGLSELSQIWRNAIKSRLE
ncbi:MAG: phosphoribosylformylglycinamidine synthase subunit PurL [Candidatus Omnitrophota bacterium]|jgi:phosphoribosylformylglycinamidine synthase